jgi:hypothetical protein
MSLTHSTTARNSAGDGVVGNLGTTAKLKYRTTGTIGSPGTAVATLPMSNPAFGAAASGVNTAGAITSDTNATGNASAIATASIETGAGTLHIHCAVAASASDINMSNGLTVAAGDTVTCSSLTYTALPA